MYYITMSTVDYKHLCLLIVAGMAVFLCNICRYGGVSAQHIVPRHPVGRAV